MLSFMLAANYYEYGVVTVVTFPLFILLTNFKLQHFDQITIAISAFRYCYSEDTYLSKLIMSFTSYFKTTLRVRKFN